MISKGQYDTKDYFIVLPALLFSAQTSGQMFSMAPDFSRATIAAKSIFRTLSQHVENVDFHAFRKGRQDSFGKIEFRNVSFKYASRSEYIVKDLSFVLPAGHRVALVGRSGCARLRSSPSFRVSTNPHPVKYSSTMWKCRNMNYLIFERESVTCLKKVPCLLDQSGSIYHSPIRPPAMSSFRKLVKRHKFGILSPRYQTVSIQSWEMVLPESPSPAVNDNVSPSPEPF